MKYQASLANPLMAVTIPSFPKKIIEVKNSPGTGGGLEEHTLKGYLQQIREPNIDEKIGQVCKGRIKLRNYLLLTLWNDRPCLTIADDIISHKSNTSLR
jgi:hypothetical protein